MSAEHEHWMNYCLQLAEKAAGADEVPVGAVVVRDGEILGEGWNRPISDSDPTAHAEIIAIRAAAKSAGNYRIPNSKLYVTIEPCAMCAGAMVHARVSELIFGAKEPRAGAVSSTLNLLDQEHLNHRVCWSGGVLEEQCGEQISRFFRQRRLGS